MTTVRRPGSSRTGYGNSAFSAGGLGPAAELPQVFPKLTAAEGRRLALLWIGCGTEDGLIEANRSMRAFLTERGVAHEGIETPGGHTWMVWRRYLVTFTEKLFK